MGKVYTKTGDDGTTSLIGGLRVKKSDPRVEAYGTVDELTAHLALLADMMASSGLKEQIIEIQKDLMALMAELAGGVVARNETKKLEHQIDEMSANLPPVAGFVIPGGHPVVSQCHVCRTVCRRAERRVSSIDHKTAGVYLNRLSDWLWVVSRKVALEFGVEQTYWKP